MRTNIVIDDKLMRDTLRATGLKTKHDAVDQALRTLLRLRRQAEIRRLAASSTGRAISRHAERQLILVDSSVWMTT